MLRVDFWFLSLSPNCIFLFRFALYIAYTYIHIYSHHNTLPPSSVPSVWALHRALWRESRRLRRTRIFGASTSFIYLDSTAKSGCSSSLLKGCLAGFPYFFSRCLLFSLSGFFFFSVKNKILPIFAEIRPQGPPAVAHSQSDGTVYYFEALSLSSNFTQLRNIKRQVLRLKWSVGSHPTLMRFVFFFFSINPKIYASPVYATFEPSSW